MQTVFACFLFISLVFFPQKIFSQVSSDKQRQQKQIALEDAVKWAYDKKKMEALLPYSTLLVDSAEVELDAFPHDEKVVSVLMREGLLAFANDEVKYIGTMGIGPCIGVVLVGKKDGKVERVALAHVDAMTDLTKSYGFFYQALEDADEVEVSLVASQGSIETALQIIERIESTVRHQKITYKSDLTISSDLVVNVQTGQLYKGLIYPSDFKESAEELTLATKKLAFSAMSPSPLKWSFYK